MPEKETKIFRVTRVKRAQSVHLTVKTMEQKKVDYVRNSKSLNIKRAVVSIVNKDVTLGRPKTIKISQPIQSKNAKIIRPSRVQRIFSVRPNSTRINRININSSVLKKALLIGINYNGTSSELGGCINDSKRLHSFLIGERYFSSGDIIMMNDYLGGEFYPTRANIIRQLQDLVRFARLNPNKKVELFVSYSGHGSYVRDTNGDELDGRDEVLCPIDYESVGCIVDDDLRRIFVDKLPRNVKLVMIIDACHSGTVLDLRYSYKANNSPLILNNRVSQTSAEIVMISGCKDAQTSADAYLSNPDTKNYEYQGAMTASLLANYQKGITYNTLIEKMRKWIKENGFDQVPQLSSGRQINIHGGFLLNYF